MKKLFLFVLALVLLAGGVSYAELQIDEGQTRGQSGSISKFFVARNGRVSGISADRVVVWDATSNDGVSVTTSTTSFDALVAGITIDAIPGITSDVTAANSAGGGQNWGRVRVYGKHANVSWDTGQTGCVAGTLVGQHGVAGTATAFRHVVGTEATGQVNATRDSVAVTTEACAAGNTVIDVFVDKG